MDPVKFLIPYQVIDSQPKQKQTEVQAQRLCSLIHCKFTVPVEPELLSDIVTYQQRLYTLIEDLRLQSIEHIEIVLNFLFEEGYLHLCNLVILCWCLPRAGQIFSKKIYHSCYQDNITEYNNKLIKLIHLPVLRVFCKEILSTRIPINIPIHCIDYLWHHMDNFQFDFIITNYSSGDYISIHQMDDNYINLKFSLQYLLEMNLGHSCRLEYSQKVQLESDPRIAFTFSRILEKFITDPLIVKQTLQSQSGTNYRLQLLEISSKPSYYLKDLIIPTCVLDLLHA